MTWPPIVGSVAWRHQFESIRIAAESLERTLLDARQYTFDPAKRADDRAMLQHLQNSLKIFALEEELLKNPTPERVAKINAERTSFASTQDEEFSFLKRLGAQSNQRFDALKAKDKTEAQLGDSPLTVKGSHASTQSLAPLDAEQLAKQVAKVLNNSQGYPLMTFEEVAHATRKSISTIRKWCDSGKLTKRSGRVVTASVKAYLGTEPAD